MVMRGGGHWLAGEAVTSGSVTDLLCDLGQGAFPALSLPYLNRFVIWKRPGADSGTQWDALGKCRMNLRARNPQTLL